MARELQHLHINHTDTLYTVLWNSTAQVWNGSAIEAYTVANWTTYAVPMTETPANGYLFVADLPDGLPAGTYTYRVFSQAGAAPAITDEVLSSQSIVKGATTQAISWTGVAGAIVPANLRSLLRIIFGAEATGAASRRTLIDQAMQDSVAWLWLYCPWTFRHRAVQLTIDAEDEWTVLPTDYYREPQTGDWLVQDGDTAVRPTFVDPSAWDVEKTHLTQCVAETGSPLIWTLGWESVEDAYVPVARWFPVPTEETVLNGFQYFAGLPAVAVDGTSPVFPDPAFNRAWRDAAVYTCSQMGLKAAETEAKLPTERAVLSAFEELRAKHQYRGVPTQSPDVMRWRDSLAVLPASYGDGSQIRESRWQ